MPRPDEIFKLRDELGRLVEGVDDVNVWGEQIGHHRLDSRLWDIIREAEFSVPGWLQDELVERLAKDILDSLEWACRRIDQRDPASVASEAFDLVASGNADEAVSLLKGE